MKKTMICLANSKKYGERCIAGIEIIPKPEGGWQMLFVTIYLRWTRSGFTTPSCTKLFLPGQ
jgi:hypothetical protein